MSTAANNWGRETVPMGELPAAAPDDRSLEIRFTGSGSEYFRIWIVNLLLTIVTLSLYKPWAKVRRLRYFYGNTLVDGHALDFHGDPKKMLRGYLLVGALFVLYSVSGRVSPLASLIAFGILLAIWPALLRAALQFRLANTSWRGMRFRFKGTTGGAYAALLPMFVPGLVFLALAALAGPQDPKHAPAWFGFAIFGVMGGTLLLMPLMWWNFKRYQHDHYALGPWQTRLAMGPGPVYGLMLKTIGLFLLCVLVIGIVFGMLSAGMLGAVFAGFAKGGKANGAAMVIIIAVTMLAMFVAQLVPVPYVQSRAQNLLWGRTSSPALDFDSRLRFGPLLGLTLKNWLLMVLTLGLYWPFAAVAMYRIRVEAVSVRLHASLDELHDPLRPATADASGDAAGDLFGIDVGF